MNKKDFIPQDNRYMSTRYDSYGSDNSSVVSTCSMSDSWSPPPACEPRETVESLLIDEVLLIPSVEVLTPAANDWISETSADVITLLTDFVDCTEVCLDSGFVTVDVSSLTSTNTGSFFKNYKKVKISNHICLSKY